MGAVTNAKSFECPDPAGTARNTGPAPQGNLAANGNLPIRCSILTYHEVVPENAAYLYSVSVAQLEEHLRMVADMRAAMRGAAGAPEVTFDDGHDSNHRYALPLLEQFAVPAIFFVTAGWIEQRPGYMTWPQLRELAARGHKVQSHGWSHKFLTHCSDAELADELRRSRLTLEERLGAGVDAISAPGGRWNRRALEAAAQAGYRRAYLSDPWVKPEERNGVHIFGRLMVRRTMDEAELRRWLNRSGQSEFFHRAQGRVKEGVKGLLGDRVYHRLWCWLALWNDPDKRGTA